MGNWPNFSSVEFERACPQCRLEDMSPSFMYRLQSARDLAGIPFFINSAFRSVSYEKRKGRPGTSMHCLGRAVDVSCKDSVSRYRIVNSALAAGFHGIGIGRNFVHLDDRESSTVIWLYD